MDLAGSERIRQTRVSTSGAHFAEMKHINGSLTVLGRCVNSLVRGSKHVPYRDSALTMMLKPAFGGNCRTELVVTCSQDAAFGDQTLTALRFGVRCGNVTNGISTDLSTLVTLRRSAAAKIAEARKALARMLHRYKAVRKLQNRTGVLPIRSRLQLANVTYGYAWQLMTTTLDLFVERWPALESVYQLVDLCQDKARASLAGEDVDDLAHVQGRDGVVDTRFAGVPNKEVMVGGFVARLRRAEKALRKQYAKQRVVLASHRAQLERLNTMHVQRR